MGSFPVFHAGVQPCRTKQIVLCVRPSVNVIMRMIYGSRYLCRLQRLWFRHSNKTIASARASAAFERGGR
jgi:hypothetical protein